LQSWYTPKLNLVICIDTSVNCLNDNDKRNQLDALLNSYNLFSTIDFPTRIYNDSNSAVDNVFIDITRLNNYQVFLLINGLSEHDLQIMILNILQNTLHEHQPYFGRNINKSTMAEFIHSFIHSFIYSFSINHTDVECVNNINNKYRQFVININISIDNASYIRVQV
jgi:hypothetical protein